MNIIRRTLQNDNATLHNCNTMRQCSVSSVLGTVNVLTAVGGGGGGGGGGVNVEVGVSICGVGI